MWQDPLGDVVLRYSLEECFIYFGCWISPGEPADYLGKLTFHDAWAVRGFHFEFLPYEVEELNYHSKILVVKDSQWLMQLSERRLSLYPEWKNWDKREYRHYVVSGHDNYYDIIATRFDEQIVPEGEAGEMARLIYET